MWSGLGLGLLVKGPIIPVLCGLTAGCWLLWRRDFRAIGQLRPVRGLLLMLAIATPWYLMSEARTPGFIDYFLVGEHFQRYLVEGWQGDLYGGVKDQPLGMIWGYLLIAAFPLSVLVPLLLVPALRKSDPTASPTTGGLTGFILIWALTAPVFFTFSENILVTYAAPSLPAFAILFALKVTPRLWRPSLSLFIVTSTLYFAAFVYVWETDYQNHRYNQKPIVDRYQEHAESDPGPLIYTGASRFSVEFYTRGEVSFSSRPTAYQVQDTFYLAVRDMWRQTNLLSGRCSTLSHHGEFTLWYCPTNEN